MAVLVMSVLVQKEGLWACIFLYLYCFSVKRLLQSGPICRNVGKLVWKCRENIWDFFVLLCSNFVKKKRLQLVSIAQCASKYTDRKKKSWGVRLVRHPIRHTDAFSHILSIPDKVFPCHTNEKCFGYIRQLLTAVPLVRSSDAILKCVSVSLTCS